MFTDLSSPQSTKVEGRNRGRKSAEECQRSGVGVKESFLGDGWGLRNQMGI